MKSNLFHVVVAICLVGGTWFASHPLSDRTTSGAVAGLIEPTTLGDALDVRTGDRFWGLQLCGVVPCSTLTVKGGGHLVTLSPQTDDNQRCFFHVMGEKQIELFGKKFQLSVNGPDQIHVERVPVSVAPAGSIAAQRRGK